MNQQLLMATDKHRNYSKWASDEIFRQAKAIKAQRDRETELLKKIGMTPHMSKLQSTLTTGDMKRYYEIADKPSTFKTPTWSDMSTPD